VDYFHREKTGQKPCYGIECWSAGKEKERFLEELVDIEALVRYFCIDEVTWQDKDVKEKKGHYPCHEFVFYEHE
jgi:hypothetical protein